MSSRIRQRLPSMQPSQTAR